MYLFVKQIPGDFSMFSRISIVVSIFSCLYFSWLPIVWAEPLAPSDLIVADGQYSNSTWRGNEPVGMKINTERYFDNKAEEGWWPGGIEMTLQGTGDANAVNGLSARINYEAGRPGGSAPTSTGIFNYPYTGKEIYACFTFRVSSNWQDHPTGTNKMFFITSSAFGGGGDPMFLMYNSDFTPPEITMDHQGLGVTIKSVGPNLASVSVPHGQWALVELHLVMNEPGKKNGEAHLWVNGIKTSEHYDIEWVNVGHIWDSFRWEPTWGGAGGTVTNKMYQEISRIYVSYK